MIKKLSERDHIRSRPNMYIGSIESTASMEYILENSKMSYQEIIFVPGLIKIINEIIDNCVDVAIKTNFESSNIISVKMDRTYVTVDDNGTGIPITKSEDGHYLPELCWNHARAGSNFDDDENRTQIGMNGVGSYATACFSKQFNGSTDDGKKSYKIKIVNGAESFTESVGKTKTQGTSVTFEPDLTMFGLTEIDDTHKLVIHQRLINLSMSFPEITFKFNGKKINVNSFKKYVNLFNPTSTLLEQDDYKFAILPNNEDDFKQFSYVNGLKIPDGGTHIDLFTNIIVGKLRDKLVKKYKTIKPGDIKNKLMVISFLKNLKNAKFNSQSKEKITNSTTEMTKYFGTIDYDRIVNIIMKTPDIIDPITETYKIKEELAKRKELKGLSKVSKRIKSEKYLPSIGVKKYLLITEGASATGGLAPVLGRKECGFYELKGKPLNSYTASQSKFAQNKELSELYKIILNEDYQYIIYATDQDLDGFHIRGLLNGFILKYLPEVKNKIGMLQTPVIGIKKAGKLQRWNYTLEESSEKLKAGESSKWYKGLGSWKESDLRHIVKTDGLLKMIDMVEWDDEELVDDWLNDKKADKRKEYIMNNVFSIASV
jgi:DNA gyrase/topoisomerase IV subunit B